MYVAEALTSLAATWLSTGLYFIASRRFGWDVTEVLAVTAVQGLVYVLGSLAASWTARRVGRLPLLVGLYVLMAVTVLPCALLSSPLPFIALLLLWTLLCALNWPVLEGLMCHGTSASEMSHRVGAYNLVWAATSALAIVTISGLMGLAPWLVFVLCTSFHAVSAGLVVWFWRRQGGWVGVHGRLDAPPELLRKRELARRLSRLALPASYTVIYALTPVLVALPAVQALPEVWQSVAISVWLVSRVLTFAAMGMTSFWHARPGLLLGAVVAMSLSFGALATLPLWADRKSVV